MLAVEYIVQNKFPKQKLFFLAGWQGIVPRFFKCKKMKCRVYLPGSSVLATKSLPLETSMLSNTKEIALKIEPT